MTIRQRCIRWAQVLALSSLLVTPTACDGCGQPARNDGGETADDVGEDAGDVQDAGEDAERDGGVLADGGGRNDGGQQGADGGDDEVTVTVIDAGGEGDAGSTADAGDTDGGDADGGELCDGCFIDGECLAEGHGDEENPCAVCDPSQDEASWSLADDGLECGENRACAAGSCVCDEGFAGDDCNSCAPLFRGYPDCRPNQQVFAEFVEGQRFHFTSGAHFDESLASIATTLEFGIFNEQGFVPFRLTTSSNGDDGVPNLDVAELVATGAANLVQDALQLLVRRSNLDSPYVAGVVDETTRYAWSTEDESLHMNHVAIETEATSEPRSASGDVPQFPEMIGAGPALEAPVAITHKSEGVYYVLDSMIPAVFEIDVVTGDRTIISGPGFGEGPPMGAPQGMLRQSDGSLVVVDMRMTSLFRIDPATGNRSIISGGTSDAQMVGMGPPWVMPSSVALASDGDFFVADLNKQNVVRVDSQNGNRTVVASNMLGTGRALGLITGLVVDDAGQLVATDTQPPQVVIRIDPQTGDRTVVSTNDGEHPVLVLLRGVKLDTDGRLLIVDMAIDALTAVDPLNGLRTNISAAADGIIPRFTDPADVVVESSDDFLVADQKLRALLRVDRLTGERTIVSGEAFAVDPPSVGPDQLLDGGVPAEVLTDGGALNVDGGVQ